jgi:hypothetical protein
MQINPHIHSELARAHAADLARDAALRRLTEGAGAPRSRREARRRRRARLVPRYA